MKNLKLIAAAIAVVLSLAMVITGIVIAASDPGYLGTNIPTDYSFGADFYTESYGAIRAVAINTATIARNANALCEVISISAGVAFIFAGLFGLLKNGKKLAEILMETKGCAQNATPAAPIVPVAPTAPATPVAEPEVEVY